MNKFPVGSRVVDKGTKQEGVVRYMSPAFQVLYGANGERELHYTHLVLFDEGEVWISSWDLAIK
jgi:hypothetical protein